MEILILIVPTSLDSDSVGVLHSVLSSCIPMFPGNGLCRHRMSLLESAWMTCTSGSPLPSYFL